MKATYALWLLLLISCSTPEAPPTSNPQSIPGEAVADTLPPPLDSARLTYLTGKFDPAEDDRFVKVAEKYTDGDPYVLRKETYEYFEQMHAAALEDGVKLIMVSATRNFARQKQIWEAKWRGERILSGGVNAAEIEDPGERARAILRYSSMPGTSRHHWGSDIDLNALNNEYFADGEGEKIYDWLVENGPTFGFCQPYTAKGADRPNGYEEEKWHWSYLPVAKPLTDFAASALNDGDIGGFEGAEAAKAIGILENYVLGVNSACKE